MVAKAMTTKAMVGSVGWVCSDIIWRGSRRRIWIKTSGVLLEADIGCVRLTWDQNAESDVPLMPSGSHGKT